MPGEQIYLFSSNSAFTTFLHDEVLTAQGFNVVLGSSTNDVLNFLADYQPDALILVPGKKDPVEIIRELLHHHPALPIILAAKKSYPQSFLNAAFRAGVSDCLLPIKSPEQILEPLQRAFSRKAALTRWAGSVSENQADDIAQRVTEMETLTRIGHNITANLNLDEVLTNVVDAAVSLTGAEEGNLLLIEESTGELYMRAERNFQNDFVKTFRLQVQDTLAGEVIRTGEPAVLDQDTPEKIKTTYLVHSLVYVPLKAHDHVIGVLGVDNRGAEKPAFTPHHVQLISALADYAAIAIDNAQLFTETLVEREKLEAILSNIGDGVLVTDENGYLILVNNSVWKTFEVEKNENYREQHASVLISNQEFLEALSSTGGTTRIEFHHKNKRHFTANLSPIPDVGKVITLQDVTHFKELDQIKSDFVRTVSHDLRSPLTAILGYIELIERVGEINERQGEFIRRVQMSVQSITNLVNDLLDLGRIEAGFESQKELVPIPTIIRYAVDGLKSSVNNKKQELHLEIEDDLPSVYGNPIRLRQMLQNLVDNANKYTPEGGTITVRARAEFEQMIIEVEDNGLGIPPSDQPYIFNKLYRASNVNINDPGSGLGLPIVSSIVEQHGGRCWFDSTLGEGTKFTVVLSVDQSKE